MSTKHECWNVYAAHIKTWYVNTYKSSKGAVKAINDGRLARKIIRTHHENVNYERLKTGGVSEFAAKTIMLYMQNTKESYMQKCVTETGGFAADVACMSDSDCPRGYRCRGRGKDSECIEEGKPLPKKPSLPSLPSMPSIGIAGKGVIGLLLFVAVAILALLAIGYSGLGGSVGRVAESEHKKKRG